MSGIRRTFYIKQKESPLRSKKLVEALAVCLCLFFFDTIIARADGSMLLVRPPLGNTFPTTPTVPTITGVAGWYGEEIGECRGCLTDRSGRFLMANGEVFDDSLPTIACGIGGSCSVLPLVTSVRITNLENGRTMTARVTDTGGFSNLDRVADCSKAVAERLGFLEEGLALVLIEVILEPQAPNLLH